MVYVLELTTPQLFRAQMRRHFKKKKTYKYNIICKCPMSELEYEDVNIWRKAGQIIFVAESGCGLISERKVI